MKALLIPGDGRVELVSLPDPTPGPGEVVIEMHRSGICGTDLKFLEETAEEAKSRAHYVPGHESSGVIAAVGPGVVHRKVGDRVIGYHHIGCGSCHYCRCDLPTQCADKTVTGRTRHGSNAQYELLPEWAVMPLADEFSFDEGVLLACNVSTAFSALRKAEVNVFRRIAIFGQGVVGLSATLLAAAQGARVAAIDLSDNRLQKASQFGADITINPMRTDVVEALRQWSGRGVDVVIECSGSEKAVAQALEALGPEGTMVFVGAGGHLDTLSNTLLGRELKLWGSSVYRPGEYDPMVRLILERQLSISRLLERTFLPEEAQAAFTLAQQRDSGKLLISWQD